MWESGEVAASRPETPQLGDLAWSWDNIELRIVKPLKVLNKAVRIITLDYNSVAFQIDKKDITFDRGGSSVPISIRTAVVDMVDKSITAKQLAQIRGAQYIDSVGRFANKVL